MILAVFLKVSSEDRYGSRCPMPGIPGLGLEANVERVPWV